MTLALPVGHDVPHQCDLRLPSGRSYNGREYLRKPVTCRILNRVTVEANGCWHFDGRLSSQGYCGGTEGYGHRLVYLAFVGPIPQDRPFIDHLCHNDDLTCVGGAACRHRACLNYREHLEPTTNGENRRRSLVDRLTHCPAGHDYAVHGYRRRGSLECRLCKVVRDRERLAARTHCDNGHLWTPETKTIRRDGVKRCLTCRAELRERRAAERLTSCARAAGLQVPDDESAS